MQLFKFLMIVCITTAVCNGTAWTVNEESNAFWVNQGGSELKSALDEENFNLNVARNVIIFLGDGMGIPSVTAGRIWKGQMEGQSGEEYETAMDSFRHIGFSKTYGLNHDGMDSAGTATAYLTGVKANIHTLGVSGAVVEGDCAAFANGIHNVESVLNDAYLSGKATGIVTTTRLNHASPSGNYAHSPSRYFYNDDDLCDEAEKYGVRDIAQQFYDNSHKFTVALGGGRGYFQPEGTWDPEYPVGSPNDPEGKENNRNDGQDLIQQWIDKYQGAGEDARYVWNLTEFEKVDPLKADRLLGMFEQKDMQYHVDRFAGAGMDGAGEPSIAEMTETAIKMLRKDEDGFFLFVEGGKIDKGHHAANAYYALNDFTAFDDAIQVAMDLTSESETLIIVTADHSHTFNLGGNSVRGNPIYGLAGSNTDPDLAYDGKTYTSLLYGSGRAFMGWGTENDEELEMSLTEGRKNTTSDLELLASKEYEQASAVPLEDEDHGAEDVVIFARGPMAHLIHKTHEQTYIPYVMRYASCIGNDLRHCGDDGDSSTQMSTTITTASSKAEVFSTFLGFQMDREETTKALYTQFILTLNLAFLTLITVSIVGSTGRRKNPSRKGEVSAINLNDLEKS